METEEVQAEAAARDKVAAAVRDKVVVWAEVHLRPVPVVLVYASRADTGSLIVLGSLVIRKNVRSAARG